MFFGRDRSFFIAKAIRDDPADEETATVHYSEDELVSPRVAPTPPRLKTPERVPLSLSVSFSMAFAAYSSEKESEC